MLCHIGTLGTDFVLLLFALSWLLSDARMDMLDFQNVCLGQNVRMVALTAGTVTLLSAFACVLRHLLESVANVLWMIASAGEVILGKEW
jgi:hypothetical protein